MEAAEINALKALHRIETLKIAQSQVGVQEIPAFSNKGPQVEMYLKSVGLGGGYAWCQAFVYWCQKQAATQLNLNLTTIRTAGVMDCWNKTDKALKIGIASARKDKSLIKVGSQFIMDFGKGLGHTGWLRRWKETISIRLKVILMPMAPEMVMLYAVANDC